MADKNLTFSFKIAGMLAGNFKASFGEASKLVKNLQNSVNANKKTMDECKNAFDQNIISVNSYNNAVKQLKTLEASKAAFDQNIISLKSYNNVCKQLNYPKDTLAVTSKLAERNNQRLKALGLTASKTGAYFVGMQQSVSIAKSILSFTDVAADFEHAMSKVGAITLGSIKDQKTYDTELAKLTARARELGETTQFSARQAADAMSYLGMAGWDSSQIIANLPHLLNLAAAGGTDLARTADILSDDLTAFGMSANDAEHMADVFATTITRTNTNIEMLGETFKYAAPVAHAFGASMEETAAMAGIMANSGIKASQAGTTLRSGLIRLAGPPKMAQKALDELGLSMEDFTAEQKEAAMALKSLGIETGNLQGAEKMASILSQLREKMAGLGKEQKLAMAGAIFGKQAATGWVTMLEAGPGSLEKLTEALKNCDGAAAEMAKRMNADAKGAAIRLKSATESLNISIGNALLPSLAEWGDSAAKLAGNLSNLASEHPGLIGNVVKVGLVLAAGAIAGNAAGFAFNGLKTVVLGASWAYGKLTYAMESYQVIAKITAGVQWLLNTAFMQSPIGRVITVLFVLATACKFVYDHVDTIRERWNKMWGEFKTSCPIIAGVFETIASVLLAPYNLVCGFVDKVKELIGLGPSASTSAADFKRLDAASVATPKVGNGRASRASVKTNAVGGIYGKGAFLTTFAEESGESAIPHTPTRRNISLLAETNRIMGNPLGRDETVINASFAPNITINTGAGPANEVVAALRSQMEEERRKFEEMLKRVEAYRRRTAYE